MDFFAHQQQVITEKDHEDRKRYGNWRGTGSGKTRTTVAIAEGKTLVVCPKTQFEDGIWPAEWLFQGRNPADLVVLSKEKFKSLAALHANNPINVCGFLPTTVIIDEAHTVAGVLPETFQKNYKKYPKVSQMYAALSAYLKAANPKRIHPLTATPSASPMALYALGSLMGFQWDYFQFRDTFYYETTLRGYSRWLPKHRRKAWKNSKPEIVEFIKREKEYAIEMAKRTKEAIGYTGTLQDWFDVPEQYHKPPIKVGVTKAQQDAYQQLRVLYPDPLVLTGKRQMLEQGVFSWYEVNEETGERIDHIDIVDENKSEEIGRYMEEFGRVVVFCRYTKQIDLYKQKFEKDFNVMTLTGQTKNRGEVIAAANTATECLFIVQSQISAGWGLPDFPCMIFASLDYSYVNYYQAVGRILRANHLKKNVYIYLLSGLGDESVYKVISEKEEFSESEHVQKLCKNKKLT